MGQEGPRFSQVLLNWGANDFGGTLINESISTAAGSEYGQLLKPKEIRHLIRGVGRIPAERDTTYRKIKRFDTEPAESEALDGVNDAKRFGSYFDLIKIKKYQYQNTREN